MSGKILIVDDVATNRIVYKVKLGAACYAPLLAADGAGCLKLAKQEKPDLILLDLMLPDMSGTEVLQRLRSDPATASIPVVVFSSDGDNASRMAALAAGADDYMTKSIDDQTLLARLRSLLRGREEFAELHNGGAPLRTLGFAEPASAFRLPGTIAFVTQRPETALRWRRELEAQLPDSLLMISREAALAEPALSPMPDVFVIECDAQNPMIGLRLMSELRCRTQTRHAAICIVQTGLVKGDAAMAYDLGANDVVAAGVDTREFGLRLSRLLERKREADQMRTSVRDGLRLAVIDPLTGLFNRRYALNHLRTIAEQARIIHSSFAVMVLDIDRFKDVNDSFGHASGDAVLTEVARRMSTNVRAGDMVARIGGEEFLIALPDTNLALARPIAERICRAIEGNSFALPGYAPLTVTASIGLAICENGRAWQEEEVAEVIDRADQALLIAKSGGRNKVTISNAAA